MSPIQELIIFQLESDFTKLYESKAQLFHNKFSLAWPEIANKLVQVYKAAKSRTELKDFIEKAKLLNGKTLINSKYFKFNF